MTGMTVQIHHDGMEVDTADLAEAFGISPAEVLRRMREGGISSVCEKGVAEDEGRYRLTFFTQTCRLQLVIDGAGAVLQRNVIDFGERSLPRALHRLEQ